jgi:hypothetical protein
MEGNLAKQLLLRFRQDQVIPTRTGTDMPGKWQFFRH